MTNSGRLAACRRWSMVAGLVVSGFATIPSLAATTYTTENPARLVVSTDHRIEIVAAPDQALYRSGHLPRIAIRSDSEQDARIEWRVTDGFGRTLTEGSGTRTEAEVTLPKGHGYYEISATLKLAGQGDITVRRSIGALPPSAPPKGDEPFGLWIQGSNLYPELGVRWTREGIWWPAYRMHGAGYLERRKALFQSFRSAGIRVIAYPKHPHPHETSREVIEDTPEAWRDLTEWWTTMVKSLAGYVDAWAVVNEPMRGHWKGNDTLILRYWALMRRIVDRYDPGTPLIGPSLNPNTPAQAAQYRHLLDLGLGANLDAVELHTYTNTPENGWGKATENFVELTSVATGKDLDVWSTEHGYTANYAGERRQARLLIRSAVEAKRIGYRVLIWHMFGNPQGKNRRERQFAIFRETLDRKAPSQPRPAGVAYGVMTRQLASARYKGRISGLDDSIVAEAFERNGQTMVAIWSLGDKPSTVALPIADGARPTMVGMFGREHELRPEAGVAHIEVGPDPVFVSPVEIK